MALTANRKVLYYVSQERVELPVLSGTCIYQGALVGQEVASGRARPLVAGDPFIGLAFTRADAQDGSDARVMLHQHVDAVFDLSGVVASDLGADVYASDDQTITLTSTGNSRIGRLAALEPNGQVRVRLQPWASRE